MKSKFFLVAAAFLGLAEGPCLDARADPSTWISIEGEEILRDLDRAAAEGDWGRYADRIAEAWMRERDWLRMDGEGRMVPFADVLRERLRAAPEAARLHEERYGRTAAEQVRVAFDRTDPEAAVRAIFSVADLPGISGMLRRAAILYADRGDRLRTAACLDWATRLAPDGASVPACRLVTLASVGESAPEDSPPSPGAFDALRVRGRRAIPLLPDHQQMASTNFRYRRREARWNSPFFAWPQPIQVPVFLGELVFLSDRGGIVALPADGGEPLWRIEGPEEHARAAVPTEFVYEHPALRVDAGGEETTLYAIRNSSDGFVPMRSPNPFNGTPHVAVADVLLAIDPGTGVVRWRYPAGASIDRVLGPPVRWADRLFFPVFVPEDASIAVAVLDPVDGRPLGRIPLGFEQGIVAACALVADGTGVYASLSNGATARVDPFRMNVRWIRVHERDITSMHETRDRNTTMYQNAAAVGWIVAPPLLRDGTVFAAPVDADWLLALDAATGDLHWTWPRNTRGGTMHLVGFHDGILLAVTDRVTAIDASTGETAWAGFPLPTVTGRPVIAGDRILVPTVAGIAVVSLDDGFWESLVPLPGGRVPGNLTWDGERVWSLDNGELLCLEPIGSGGEAPSGLPVWAEPLAARDRAVRDAVENRLAGSDDPPDAALREIRERNGHSEINARAARILVRRERRRGMTRMMALFPPDVAERAGDLIRKLESSDPREAFGAAGDLIRTTPVDERIAMFRALLQHPSREVQGHVGRLLHHLPDGEEADAFLIEIAAQDDPLSRRGVLNVIARRETLTAPLREILFDGLKDPDIGAQLMAIRRLIRDPESHLRLLDLMFDTDAAGEFRISVMFNSLGEHARPEWIPTLIRRLREPPGARSREGRQMEQQARQWCALLLGRLDAEEAIPVLRETLEAAERNDWFRSSLAIALAELGEPEGVLPILYPIARSDGSGRNEMYARAVMVLAEFGDRNAVQGLISLLVSAEGERRDPGPIREHLERLTGHRVETDDPTPLVRGWLAWWDEHRDDYVGE